MPVSPTIAPPAGKRYPPSETPGMAPLRFTDAQEQASALHGWNQDYLQLSAGAFRGELNEVKGSGIRLFIEQVEQSVLQTGVLDSQVLAAGIALRANAAGLFCGAPCGADSMHIFSGSSGFEFRPSPEHTMLGIELLLEHSAMGAVAGACGFDPILPSQPRVLKPAPAAMVDMKSHLLGLFDAARNDPQLLSNPAIAATVADFMLDHIASCLPTIAAPGGRNGQWNLVQRAIARVRACPEQPPTVARLCQELGVSRRTLQCGFRQVLGIGPLAYLKAVRLHQARRALKQAGSVTEAATSCGFWHFGHFSQDYQIFFREKPSETLRRHNRA